MALAQLDPVRKVFDRVRDSADSDAELLARYRTLRETGGGFGGTRGGFPREAEDAFGSLVRRHGPMVLGVCRRVLRDPHAADDAFQATFLVLAKKADAVRPPDRLAPWLYGVAYRTALKARGRAFRRRQVEQRYAATVGLEAANRTTPGEPAEVDLLPVIDEQLNALPEKYRTPLLLCAVQGLNKSEAAERLGLPEGTVSSRLARAREMLRDRLARRGFVVPAVALGAVLTADTLQAAVPPALAASAAGVAAGSALVPTTVLSLSHEVLRSMTLLKLKTLCVVALSVTLVGGGFGFYALRADEKKPAGEKPATEKPTGEKPRPEKPTGEKPKPEKPTGDKPAGEKPVKPGNPDGDKPRPEGDKPRPEKPGGDKRPVLRFAGKVASVDAKDNTIMLAVKGDGGVVEKLYPLAADAKVFIDGKPGKLADVPKNSTAAFNAIATRDGELPRITELRVTGAHFTGVIAKIDAKSVTLESEKKPREFDLTADTKITVNGKDAKPADLKAGDRVTVTLAADEKSALAVATGRAADGEKPGAEKPRPERAKKFGGKVAAVDVKAGTITLASKGEAGREMVVRVVADAKITVDGKPAKLADIRKGMTATFNLSSAKDGQLREVDEVAVAGLNFGGTVKQIDTTTVTVGNEKTDRVLKLAPGGKVMIGEKEGKLSDLKVGDRVSVTLNSDESAAVLIVAGGKKPVGDRPRPDKEDEDEDQ